MMRRSGIGVQEEKEEKDEEKEDEEKRTYCTIVAVLGSRLL